MFWLHPQVSMIVYVQYNLGYELNICICVKVAYNYRGGGSQSVRSARHQVIIPVLVLVTIVLLLVAIRPSTHHTIPNLFMTSLHATSCGCHILKSCLPLNPILIKKGIPNCMVICLHQWVKGINSSFCFQVFWGKPLWRKNQFLLVSF